MDLVIGMLVGSVATWVGVWLGAMIYSRGLKNQPMTPQKQHRPVIRDPLEEQIIERRYQKESLKRVGDQFGVPVYTEKEDDTDHTG